MVYLKSLVMNFLLIFFANHVIPGTMIVYPTKLPHIGGDVMFAASLAVLNMLVYPVLRLLQKEVGEVKVAIACLILNFSLPHFTSRITALSRSSNSPRNFAPAINAPMSKATTRL